MVTTPGPVIEPENLPPQIVAHHDEPFTLDFDHRRPLPEITAEFTERIECAYLQRVLEKYRGRIELCAEHCGLSRRSISEKLRRYQIDKRDFKPHVSRRKQFAMAGDVRSARRRDSTDRRGGPDQFVGRVPGAEAFEEELRADHPR